MTKTKKCNVDLTPHSSGSGDCHHKKHMWFSNNGGHQACSIGEVTEPPPVEQPHAGLAMGRHDMNLDGSDFVSLSISIQR